MTLVKIIGGHGKVALLAAKQLSQFPNVTVESFIRKPEQQKDIEDVGAKPVIFDVTNSSPTELQRQLQDAQFVVWAAGAGGKGGPEATYKIDRDGAIAVVDALKSSTTLKRFIIVSAIGTDFASVIGPEFPLYNYYQAKAAADRHLAGSGIPYTILGPGALSLDPPSGKIDAKLSREETDLRTPINRSVSRANVASVISTLITNDEVQKHQLNKTIEFLDGDVPIAEALTK